MRFSLIALFAVLCVVFASVRAIEDVPAAGLLEVATETEAAKPHLDKYTCPSKYKLRTKPGKTVTANGCGPESMKLFTKGLTKLVPAAATRCCNAHDLAYGKCGGSKNSADTAFRTCLQLAVKAQPKLKLLPMAFYEAVHLLGTSPFEEAQKEFCQCADTAGKTASMIPVFA